MQFKKLPFIKNNVIKNSKNNVTKNKKIKKVIIKIFGKIFGKQKYIMKKKHEKKTCVKKTYVGNFPSLEIPTQNRSIMSSIKFSFFGNSYLKQVDYVIHQNFLFW